MRRLRPYKDQAAAAEHQRRRSVDEEARLAEDEERIRRETAEKTRQVADGISEGGGAEQLETLGEALTTASALLAGAATSRRTAEERLISCRQEVERARAQEDLERRRDQVLRTLLGAGLLLALGLGVALLSFHPGAWWQILAMVFASFVTAVLAFAVWASTRQFAWFGVATFVAIGVVFGLTKYYSVENDPQVLPAAVLRADREPAAGFLVAKTDDELLLGRTHPRSAGDRLVVMPRDEVEDISIGEAASPGTARVRALALALELCGQFSEDKRQVDALSA